MKKLMLTAVCIFNLAMLPAQYVGQQVIPLDKYTVLDSAQYKFIYSFKYHKSYSRAGESDEMCNDKQCLLIGKNVSKYCSENYFDFCKNWKAGDFSMVSENSACGFEVFKNYPPSNISVTELAGPYLLGGNFKYEEPIPAFDWKTSNDTCTVLNYLCYKATVTFRGRTYTAWFAPEISSNNGPWKFGGLPGLILKIQDQDQNFIFECVGIEQLKTPEPICFYTINHIKITRKQLYKTYERFFANPMQFWQGIGSPLYKEMEGMELPTLMYIPIELN